MVADNYVMDHFPLFPPIWGKEVSIGKKAAPNRNKRWLIVIHIAADSVMC